MEELRWMLVLVLAAAAKVDVEVVVAAREEEEVMAARRGMNCCPRRKHGLLSRLHFKLACMKLVSAKVLRVLQVQP